MNKAQKEVFVGIIILIIAVITFPLWLLPVAIWYYISGMDQFYTQEK